MILSTSFREFLSYIGGSFVALIVDFGLLLLFVEFVGWHYLAASALGFAAGGLVLYLLSIVFIFHERRLRNQHAEFLIFMSIGIAGLALTQAGMFIGVEWLRWPYPLAKTVTVGGVFWFNFVMRRHLLFRLNAKLMI